MTPERIKRALTVALATSPLWLGCLCCGSWMGGAPNVVVRVRNETSTDLCEVVTGGDVDHFPDVGRLAMGSTAETLGTYRGGGVWVSFRRCGSPRWVLASYEDYVMRWSVHEVVITDDLSQAHRFEECDERCPRPPSYVGVPRTRPDQP